MCSSCGTSELVVRPGSVLSSRKYIPSLGRHDVGARVALAAERGVSVERGLLRCARHLVRDLRRTDLARSAAEVFAVVVEFAAGVDFDLDHRQREELSVALDDADRQLAPFDELLDDVGQLQLRDLSYDVFDVVAAVEEEEAAARSCGQWLEDDARMALEHRMDR